MLRNPQAIVLRQNVHYFLIITIGSWSSHILSLVLAKLGFKAVQQIAFMENFPYMYMFLKWCTVKLIITSQYLSNTIFPIHNEAKARNNAKVSTLRLELEELKNQ